MSATTKRGFSTGNEENDLWFRNVLTGIYFDGSSQGQAEQLVMRCRFDRCANGGGPCGRERINRFNLDNVGASQLGQLWESKLFARGRGDDQFELIAHFLSAEAVDESPNSRKVIRDNGDGKLRSSSPLRRHRRANYVSVLCHVRSI